MPVSVLSYPGCCTAKILVGFGQESNAGGTARAPTRSPEALKVEVDKAIRGYMIGRYMGIVSACLTSRQVNGVQALTELGFHSSGAKKKNGHRESDLLTFYINPAEYLDERPNPYTTLVDPNAPKPVKRLVKNLKPEAKLSRNRYMRLARQGWRVAYYQELADLIMEDPNNFIE